MKGKTYRSYSNVLRHTIEYKIYGGKSDKFILMFPTQSSRYFSYEQHKFMDILEKYVANDKYTFVTVDSIDWETVDAVDNTNEEYRTKLLDKYIDYIVKELVPKLKYKKLYSFGISMGAFYAADVYFRYPDIFNGCIALSGIYSLDTFFSIKNEYVYKNSPIDFLQNITQDKLKQYNTTKSYFCCGQGQYEDLTKSHLIKLQEICSKYNITSAQFDLWGYDVSHNWQWWEKQIIYILDENGNINN